MTNLVDRLRASTPITALLGQSQSTYRVREAMDEGLIVLACPGSGGTRERLLANLLALRPAARGAHEGRRSRPTRRRPFWVFLDEVQTYDGAASGNLAALLEQTRQVRPAGGLLNQNPERLNPQTLNALTTNRSHLLATRAQLPRRRAGHQGVGRASRPGGADPAAAATASSPRSPTAAS